MKARFVLGVAASLTSLAAAAETIEMKVNGLVCSFCAQGIEKTLRKNPATLDVLVSLEKKLVVVSTKDGADIPDADLTRAMTDAGYEVQDIARTQRTMAEIRQLTRKAGT